MRASVVWNTGSVVVAPRPQSTGSIVVVHGLTCSTACGIFLNQEWNLCLLLWQADSLLSQQQGSPSKYFLSAYMLDTLLGSIDFSFDYGIYNLKERDNQ